MTAKRLDASAGKAGRSADLAARTGSTRSDSLPFRGARTDTESRFDANQLRILRKLLGSQADDVLPSIEQAVAAYRETEEAVRETEQQRIANTNAHVRDAKALLRRAEQLSALLDQVRVRIVEAESLNFVDGGRGNLIYSESQRALANLYVMALAWHRAAAAAGHQKRGPKIGVRRQLALWVGGRAHSIGVRLTKSPDGVFARILEIVYEAAGIDVPQDLYRDVAYVVAARARAKAKNS